MLRIQNPKCMKALNPEAIKKYAIELGFTQLGITKAKKLEKEAKLLEEWLNQNYHGEMSYMERYFDQRIDPQVLMPGTKSILVLSANYFNEYEPSSDLKIAKYAYGKDYHLVLKKKAKQIILKLQELYGDIEARAFVDSAPVMERVWASEAGISWNGKNTLSIHPREGSYFFLVCIFVDIEFEYDSSFHDHCGTCRKCIDACPTEAIHPDGYILDGSKCISYLTIELKNEIPKEYHGNMENWVFGCDICQDVCPWNKFKKISEIEEFSSRGGLLDLSKDEWMNMTQEAFDIIAKQSPIKRTKLEGMKRNVRTIKEIN